MRPSKLRQMVRHGQMACCAATHREAAHLHRSRVPFARTDTAYRNGIGISCYVFVPPHAVRLPHLVCIVCWRLFSLGRKAELRAVGISSSAGSSRSGLAIISRIFRNLGCKPTGTAGPTVLDARRRRARLRRPADPGRAAYSFVAAWWLRGTQGSSLTPQLNLRADQSSATTQVMLGQAPR